MDVSEEPAVKYRFTQYRNVESNPAWSSLSAVVNDRYILLPKDKFLYKPNANWADSYAFLADLLNEQP